MAFLPAMFDMGAGPARPPEFTPSISLTVLQESVKDDSTAAWFWLVEINAQDGLTVRLTSNDSTVELEGQDYAPYPFEFEPIEHRGDGSLPLITMRLPVFGFIAIPVIESGGLIGRTVRVRLANENALAEPEGLPSQILEVESARVRWLEVELVLGFPSLRELKGPTRRANRSICWHRYRDPETCQYAGELPSCARTQDACDEHENSMNFGGYPGIQRTNL